jgi:translation initiation factor 2 subunit 2
MTDLYDYDSLLNRVRDAIPENIVARERFEVPKAEILYEGKNTIIKNFMEIVKKIDRDPMHVYKYLMRELGTAGNIQGDRLILKGRVSSSLIQNRVDSYIKTYVICYECGSPDTELRKEGRIEILVCKACGAIRPVHGKVAVRMATAKLEEGKIYEVEITDLSRDGDGIAKYGEYTIYIPGARKGERVKVKIMKIKKNVAFGRIAS